MRSSSGGFTSAENGGKLGHANPSRDRLVYVMTQIIGHHVDVHVKNGSVISGIFHATNTDKDFGIVLKMAQPIKDTSVGGQINPTDVLRKPETMIIPARELVQVFAKDVTLGGDELPKGPVHDKRKDLMIDSAISRSHFPEERELERWAPDEGDSDCIELEKFDRKGPRSWDQFETNAALFGVKSTFNEDLYTTKLERGPHMRELEKHASRIAREIEGEDTEDLHLAEERGLYLDEDLEHDEEIKYSAVRRDTDTTVKPFMNVPSRPGSMDTKDLPVCSSTMDDKSSSHIFGGTHLSATAATGELASEYQSNKLLPADANRLDGKRSKDGSSDKDNRNLQPENTLPGGRPLVSEDLEGAPSRSRASEPSSSGQGNKSSDGSPDSTLPSKLPSAPEHANSSQRPGSSTPLTSERVAANSAASAAPGLSPSSSMGSLSSDKSSLNPNAKEFKLNPNAKSFTPLTSPRPPHPPAPDATYYYPNNMGATLGPGLPVGMGFPQANGGQPVVYNARPGSSPQGYMHPSGQQYGQQMMMGQTRPVYYYAHMSLPSTIIKLTLGLLWCIIHLAISFLSLCSHLIFNLECSLISSGLLWKYRNLQLARLKYLAIVVDSREAKNTVKINQLLSWLKTLGLKYVCLYDIDGVLKKLFEPGMNGSRDNNPGDYLDVSANIKALDYCHKQMTIECISGSDGKEGIAKAANLLCSTYLNGDNCTRENVKSEETVKNEPVFTETDMASALKSIGCAGPEPDLLFVYGPARCHLGFPTWRLRYTEIMHMGSLKSMKYGAIVKALHNYSKKHQNYGK